MESYNTIPQYIRINQNIYDCQNLYKKLPYANEPLKRSKTSKALPIISDFSTKASINSTSKLASWHQRINNRLCRLNVNNA